LSDCGFRESDVDRVVEEAMKSGNVTVNPRATSKDQLAVVLRRAL
jgi:alcohol dehydrogenase class IV